MSTAAAGRRRNTIVPKRRRKHYSYDESLDESARLIADEPTAIESETPAEENEPMERAEENIPAETPAFEE